MLTQSCCRQAQQVVQNAPLNEEGTGPAPKSGSSFQPLGTNVGAIATPQQNTEAALASMGQGGHQLSSSTSQGGEQKQQSRFQNNPYFRYFCSSRSRVCSCTLETPEAGREASAPAILPCP